MYNGQIIRQLLDQRNIPNSDLLNYLGTKSNCSITQLVHGNPTAKKLEKIADFFHCSIDVFFERGYDYTKKPFISQGSEEQYQERIRLLEQLLEEKEKRIRLFEKLLDGLDSK